MLHALAALLCDAPGDLARASVRIMHSMALLPLDLKPVSEADSESDSAVDPPAESAAALEDVLDTDSSDDSVADSAADTADNSANNSEDVSGSDSGDESEADSAADREDDVFSRRDPRLCSALLRNPAYMNPLATFILVKMPAGPVEELTKRQVAACLALDLFILLLGDKGTLFFKQELDFPPER